MDGSWEMAGCFRQLQHAYLVRTVRSTPTSPPSGPATVLAKAFHPNHISKSAIAALTFPAAPAAIIRVVASLWQMD
jgi:hypothetical protein